jgi:hypothetical protein
LVSDAHAAATIIVAKASAPARRVAALRRYVTVWLDPSPGPRIDLHWLVGELGRFPVTSLLVEGGGEVHAALLEARLAHRTAFFYGPKVIGGTDAPRGVAGEGFQSLEDAPRLLELALTKKNLRLDGLMTIAPLGATPAEAADHAQRTFNQLRALRDDLAARFQIPLRELSMGMSGDLAPAIAAGSTQVRVGSALYGAR